MGIDFGPSLPENKVVQSLGLRQKCLMTAQTLDYSVIVCTRNRAAGLVACLNSIAAAMAQCSGHTGEIVLVDNGSTDATQSTAEGWRASRSITLNLTLEATQGLSNARNHGIRAARGTLLIFIDDDCHMDPNYLVEALAYDAADSTPTLRGGSVHLGDSTDQPLTIKTLSERKAWSRAERSARHDNLGNSILGCNMVMRRILADTVGDFDPDLGVGSRLPGGEDIDYVCRAYLAGFPIEYVPDMRVFHFHGRKHLSDGLQLFKNYSIGGGALYAKYLFTHLDFCRQLWWDIKVMVKEILSGKNLFEVELGFTMRAKVYYCLSGMLHYWKIRCF